MCREVSIGSVHSHMPCTQHSTGLLEWEVLLCVSQGLSDPHLGYGTPIYPQTPDQPQVPTHTTPSPSHTPLFGMPWGHGNSECFSNCLIRQLGIRAYEGDGSWGCAHGAFGKGGSYGCDCTCVCVGGGGLCYCWRIDVYVCKLTPLKGWHSHICAVQSRKSKNKCF